MAKRVFFSFHYEDVENFRANVVRNHWVLKPNREICGYYDASIWEKAKTNGEAALKRLINDGLNNTSNTCVLIGSQTYERPWVRYEILKSFLKGNHIFAVHINSIKGKDGRTKPLGPNPLSYLRVKFSYDGYFVDLFELVRGHWVPYTKINGVSRHRFLNNQWNRYGHTYNLSDLYSTYDWVKNNGNQNFASWVK